MTRSGPARVLHIVTQVLTPAAIFLTALRLLLTPTFVRAAYRMPGFPEDPYGLTREDRLHWSGLSLEYLLNREGIEFLGDLRFEDGVGVFNDRELGHMQDVKDLTQTVLGVWVGSLIGLLATGFGAYLMRIQDAFWQGIARGVRWTLLIMGGLTLLLLVSFPLVFVGFHRIFFQGDTWLFPYTDTLIRLFPERFWQQVFAALVGATLLLSGLAYLIARLNQKSPASS